MICPHCGGCGEIPDEQDVIAARIRELKAYCLAQGYTAATFDNLVKQSVAAELLDRSERTLERWRYEGGPIQPVRRNLWSLADIARLQLDGECK